MQADQRHGQRGAVLIHVAFALLALIAFSVFVFDYGVLWVSRRQAQNAADAAAHAGAVALGFDGLDDETNARASAVNAGRVNLIWGNTTFVQDADVTFPPCPTDGSDRCIKVDVHRDGTSASSKLPLMFGRIAGLTDQEIKATATAEVLIGDATDCLKPWAVIDKWAEHWEDGAPSTLPWSEDSNFDKYQTNGADKGEIDPLITTPDVYVAPTTSDPGTGFHPYNADRTFTSDYGRQLTLKSGTQSDFDFATGWFAALALEDSKGGHDYLNNIKSCIGVTWQIGDELPVDTEPGEKVGPTRQAVATDIDSIVNQDPTAVWNSSMNGGHGGVDNSAFAVSPRIVAVPLVNPDIMAEVNKGGRTTVPISNIMGFFVEGMSADNKGVVGRLMTMPGLKAGTAPSEVGPESGFLLSIVLVR